LFFALITACSPGPPIVAHPAAASANGANHFMLALKATLLVDGSPVSLRRL